MTVRELIAFLLSVRNQNSIVEVCPCRERSCVLEPLTKDMIHDESPLLTIEDR